ncbi:DUF6090 family protein [Ekhidna sp.]|uniref:DUF6090 family protein n=1 Tax=Ekhidna sp. TaxID=2608089 RepID=UPI003BAB0528
MEKKSVLRYLIELVIVIVGVTIAFWLNTRAESIKENQTLKNYYTELLSDLKQDSVLLANSIKLNERKVNLMVRAMGLYGQVPVNRDSIFIYSQQVGNYYFFEPNDITYQSMINSGDFKLISNLELKRQLVSLYHRYETIEEFQDNHLQALDDNYFPHYVQLVDYITYQPIKPLEKDILIKNYFAYSANDVNGHVNFYRSALRKVIKLDSLISEEL